jgi:hypothetical protein
MHLGFAYLAVARNFELKHFAHYRRRGAAVTTIFRYKLLHTLQER